jgi:hypothetical protein
VFGRVFLRIFSLDDRESVMLDLDTTSRNAILPQMSTTLWHCNRCDAFISIHTAQLLDEAFCPACGKVLLEFCGSLSSLPGIQFGEA